MLIYEIEKLQYIIDLCKLMLWKEKEVLFLLKINRIYI